MYSVTEELVAWLAELGYKASTKVPKGAPGDPAEFVTLERASGYAQDLVDYPTVAVQTWAPTEDRAEEMANAIKLATLGALPEGVHSMRVNAGPYGYPDPNGICPRWQTLYDVSCRFV